MALSTVSAAQCPERVPLLMLKVVPSCTYVVPSLQGWSGHWALGAVRPLRASTTQHSTVLPCPARLFSCICHQPLFFLLAIRSRPRPLRPRPRPPPPPPHCATSHSIARSTQFLTFPTPLCRKQKATFCRIKLSINLLFVADPAQKILFFFFFSFFSSLSSPSIATPSTFSWIERVELSSSPLLLKSRGNPY